MSVNIHAHMNTIAPYTFETLRVPLSLELRVHETIDCAWAVQSCGTTRLELLHILSKLQTQRQPLPYHACAVCFCGSSNFASTSPNTHTLGIYMFSHHDCLRPTDGALLFLCPSPSFFFLPPPKIIKYDTINAAGRQE